MDGDISFGLRKYHSFCSQYQITLFCYFLIFLSLHLTLPFGTAMYGHTYVTAFPIPHPYLLLSFLEYQHSHFAR